MATGAEHTKRLFAASSYFASLTTPENEQFKERYRAIHAGCAPVLNALGQSLYEGIHFYAALREQWRRGPRSDEEEGEQQRDGGGEALERHDGYPRSALKLKPRCTRSVCPGNSAGNGGKGFASVIARSAVWS